MKTILYLLQKEFKQIFRDKAMLPIIFVVPVVQLLLLPLAANYEVRNINLSIVDHDHSAQSRELITKITASGYFRLQSYNNSYKTAFQSIESDRSDLILEIPAGFEKRLMRESRDKVFIAVNAINGVKANLGGAYLNMILRDYNVEVNTQVSNSLITNTPTQNYSGSNTPITDYRSPITGSPTPTQNYSGASPLITDHRLLITEPSQTPPLTTHHLPLTPPSVTITSTNWYNPTMNYHLFMVPGILALLVTMIGGFICALNIVKEKEIGTIEQINVTPIKKHHFILGKLIPFWVIGLVVFSIGLLVARLVYGIVPVGSLALLYCFIAVYLLAVLGFGLLVSTFADTQQQAMFVAFFFVMIFILMGGLFTSIDSMPAWAKVIATLNPVSYMIDVMRMIVLKGSGFIDIQWHLLKVVGFAVVLNSWAIINYRKTT